MNIREQFDEWAKDKVFDASFGSVDRAYIQWLEEKVNKAHVESNNALYFNDNSDYETALWEILSLTSDAEYPEDLEYIEDASN